eukprot:gnl/TRDRNA2_/TRDRNA2_191959_c0_seq1.p1 gnl/TRDRNA2_/TRDRNA2_191959_c0~~gnl/TRDRNA2_/TRDRNA2_191959_c0_seq1.p1  ORF type:complete len:174 (-),score=22.58 gnl/TRDRNA2_/TRDRNA2_191959_c0_seq1:59-538(-)
MAPPAFATRFLGLSVGLTVVFGKLGALLPFVVGSSCVPSLTFYTIVLGLGDAADEEKQGHATYDFTRYTFLAPVYIGSMNAIGALVSKILDVDGMRRFVLTWAMAQSITLAKVVTSGAYNFTSKKEWGTYVGGQLAVYAMIYPGICQVVENIIVKNIKG